MADNRCSFIRNDLEDTAAGDRGELLELRVLGPVVKTRCDQVVRVLADPDPYFLEKFRVGGLVHNRDHGRDMEPFCKPAGASG
jgi:hypothetical protein